MTRATAQAMPEWPIYARISGSVVIVGLGSIGRATLPLLLRHIGCDPTQITVIDPDDTHRSMVEQVGGRFQKVALTPANYRAVLAPLFQANPEQGFLINLSVDVDSAALMALCRELNTLYIDTVVEPWQGYYHNPELPMSARTNYALREAVLQQRRQYPEGPTAVSCCGANPGAVSWFVKQALLDLAAMLGMKTAVPATRAAWAHLMQRVGVTGVHIAERDTQRAATPKPAGVFVNTWSVEGLISEGLQPAETGWGTHEKSLPPMGRRHAKGCGAAIYLERPGAGTRIRSWTPATGAQHAFMITHNEAISIADYFTLRVGTRVAYRPTCCYAYHPTDATVLSLHEMAGAGWRRQPETHILGVDEIVAGADYLGVMLYGHAKNAYWYGSQLTIDEARHLAPHQNATGLQVSSAVLAGIVWALENPRRGIVEADEMDFLRCLEIQKPYLGSMLGVTTDWNPLVGRDQLFPEVIDNSDPWQFSNILVEDSVPESGPVKRTRPAADVVVKFQSRVAKARKATK